MKIILWIVAIIFIVGLLTITGVLKLIFKASALSPPLRARLSSCLETRAHRAQRRHHRQHHAAGNRAEHHVQQGWNDTLQNMPQRRHHRSVGKPSPQTDDVPAADRGSGCRRRP